MSEYWMILFIAAGFLSGSVLYSRIIPKAFLHRDICGMSDDGNPGAFNAFRHCGKKVGALCLTMDILKGLIPVLAASILFGGDNCLFAFVMLAPVLGHAVGIFNRFHGGKCIAVSFGVMLGILPVSWIGFAVLAALYVFFSAVAKISPNSLRSVIVYALYAVVTCVALVLVGKLSVALGCVSVAAVTVVKHMKEFFPARKASAEE